MVQVIGQTDIAAMLAAFERSDFERLTIQVGSMHVTANRAFSEVDATAPTAAPANAGEETVAIVAPMLGIFQAGLQANAKPLVRPGDTIGEDTVIGTIRVRRKFNPVRAGRHGTVAAVLVRDGDFVEYGQALLEVDRVDVAAPGRVR